MVIPGLEAGDYLRILSELFMKVKKLIVTSFAFVTSFALEDDPFQQVLAIHITNATSHLTIKFLRTPRLLSNTYRGNHVVCFHGEL